MPLRSYLQTFGADLQKLYFPYRPLKDENVLKGGLPRWRDFEDTLTRQHQLNAEWIQYKYLIEEQGLTERVAFEAMGLKRPPMKGPDVYKIMMKRWKGRGISSCRSF